MVIDKGRELSFARGCKLAFAMFVLVCGFAGKARGQQGSAPQFDMSATYSYVRAYPGNATGGYNLNGGTASLAYHFTDRFSVLGEFGGYHFSGLPAPIGSNIFTYLFGPRISLRKSGRVIPFAQVLAGGGRLNASAGSASAGENSFAAAAGGGLDVGAGSHFAIRVVEADYLLTRFARVTGASATQNDMRISTGIIFRFGER